MSEWKKVRLGEVLSIKHGYAFPGEGIVSEDNGVVLVTPGNFLIGGGFKESGKKFFRGDYPSEYQFAGGELVVTMTDLSKTSDTLGVSAKIPYSKRCVYLHNQRIGLVTITDKSADEDFIYWFMRTDQYRKVIVAGASGTTVKHTSPSRIQDVELRLPPLPSQRKIAAVLSSLDDKIENNRKICANLEAQAQAIFKSWFVDFEPFGGKMPQGWKEVPLSSIATYLNGLAMQKYRPSDDEDSLPVLKIKELRQGFCDSASERCSASIDPRYIIHDGDVIFSWSGSLLVDFWCGGMAGLNQHLFKVYSNKYDKWFVYSWTNHYLASFIKIAADKATTMGHITRDHLDDAKVCIPFDSDIEQVGRVMKPLYDEVIAKRIESRSLAALRDALLPKLMSGEIDVEKVEVA